MKRVLILTVYLLLVATPLLRAQGQGNQSIPGGFPSPGPIGGTTPSTGAFTNVTVTSNSGAALSPIVPFNIANYCGSATNYVTVFTLNGYQPCAEQSMFFGAPTTAPGFGTFTHRVDLVTLAGTNVQSAAADGSFATCNGNNSGGTATDNNTNCLAEVVNAASSLTTASVNVIALDVVGQSAFTGTGQTHTVQANQSLVNCARTPGWFGDPTNDYCSVQSNVLQSGSQSASAAFIVASSSVGKGFLMDEMMTDGINTGHSILHGAAVAAPDTGYWCAASVTQCHFIGAGAPYTTNSGNAQRYSDSPTWGVVLGEKAANSGQSNTETFFSTNAGTACTQNASPTGATESGSVITITCNAAISGNFATGSIAHITGTGVTGYNIDCVIQSVASPSFTCNNSTLGLVASGGGSVTASARQAWTDWEDASGNRNHGFASPPSGNGTTQIQFTSVGAMRAGDGTASLPSLTFLNAPSTGFYHTTTNLWLTSNGTTQELFGANIIRRGSASIDGWSSNADPSLAISDTNLSRSAAGILQVGTGETANASGTMKAAAYQTGTNCSSSASPAVCGSAAAGSVALPTNAVSSSIQVNTTAVTANSLIFAFADDTLGTKLGITCNSTLATLVGGLTISGRSAGTSFTIANNVAVVTNALCVSYWIVN